MTRALAVATVAFFCRSHAQPLNKITSCGSLTATSVESDGVEYKVVNTMETGSGAYVIRITNRTGADFVPHLLGSELHLDRPDIPPLRSDARCDPLIKPRSRDRCHLFFDRASSDPAEERAIFDKIDATGAKAVVLELATLEGEKIGSLCVKNFTPNAGDLQANEKFERE